MGWRTDWLYRLIFQQVGFVWERMHKADVHGEFKNAPDFLLVQECGAANWDSANCLLPVMRVWRFDEAGLTPITPAKAQEEPPTLVRGMYYTSGLVQFHIAERRDRAVFTYMVGPRYGRGRIWQVKGQGATGKLVPAPDATGWIS